MSANLAYAEPLQDESARRVQDDRHLIRYGCMMGPDINLALMGGSRFVGEWPGDLVPARQLLTIPEARALGPYEVPATIMHGDAMIQQGPSFGAGMENMIPAPPTSTPDALRGNGGSRLTQFINPPKVCAFLLMRQYESRGMCLFEKVKGADREAVRKMYSLFMPFSASRGNWDKGQIAELGWDLEREVLGQTVRGPFLNDLRPYLRQGGPAGERIKEAIQQAGSRQATAEQIAGAKEMVLQMRAAADRAWGFFNTHLNATESEIRRFRDGKPGKQYYDLPDERFTGGTLPLDIVAMANTGRVPIDMQSASEAASRLTEQNEVYMKGFELIADKIATANKGGVTMEDVNALLDQRDAYWKGELDRLGAKSAPVEKLPEA